VVSDVYIVNYHYPNEVTKKLYKVRLENGGKKIKVKLNEKGDFMQFISLKKPNSTLGFFILKICSIHILNKHPQESL